ncbi:spore cortex-lytic enzyme [Metabacillus halosaccharovorans]
MKNMRIMMMVVVMTFTTITYQFILHHTPAAHAFSGQIIQRGATGSDVIELQARLQYNGYYHGPIDGVYGWSTYWAVKNFQDMFGLEEVDGLVGQKTKDMLATSTKFYSDFVYEQINKGRRFTHYGGVPLDIQSAPTDQEIKRARQIAEQRKIESEKQYKAQANNQQAKQQEQQRQQQAQQKQQQEQQQQQAQQKQQQEQQQQQAQQKQQEQQQQQNQQAKQQEQQQQQAQQNNKNEQAKQPSQPKKDTNQQQNDSTAVNMPGGFSQNDIQLMANAVYGEARGEPYIGQVAVAAVILNRVNSPTFPNTVSGVIFEPLAFTAVADGQIWLTPNENAKKAVLDAINGFDPTENAIYYFNPNTATSSWIWGRPQIKRIGKHIFCK